MSKPVGTHLKIMETSQYFRTKCSWFTIPLNTPLFSFQMTSPVSLVDRTHRLHLRRGVRPHPTGDIKPSDGEAPVMLELWGMQSTSSLPSLPCPL